MIRRSESGAVYGESREQQPVPEWRQRKEGLESGEHKERVSLPETLYRQPKLGHVYQLFKHGELPLQHHRWTDDSKVEGNSVGSFWFERPLRLSSPLGPTDLLLVTKPDSWLQEPQDVQSSMMRYRRNSDFESRPTWGFGSEMGSVIKRHREEPEYHVGNRLSEKEVELYVGRHTTWAAERGVEVIEALLNGEPVDRNVFERVNDFLRDIETGIYLPDEQEYPKKPFSRDSDSVTYSYQHGKEVVSVVLTEKERADLKDKQRFFSWLLEQPRLEDHKEEFAMEDLFNGWEVT